MKNMRVRSLVVAALVALASPASSAPIDIVLTLDPDQTGPLYSWCLTLDVAAGYEVGAVDLLLTGVDSFSINTANPGIGVLDSAFVLDPLGDGRSVLIVNNFENGVAIAAGPITGALLGTFSSAYSTAPPVGLFDCEFECGGTVFDVNLVQFPASEFSISVVTGPPVGAIPEPRYLGYVSMLIAGITIARASRSRSREGSPRL